MAISEERIFVINPFAVLGRIAVVYFVIVLLMAILLFAFAFVSGGKGLIFFLEGFGLKILVISVGIFLFLALIMSFIKKRTIVCSPKEVNISSVNAWGNSAPTENFRWKDVTGTNLKQVYVPGRGGGNYLILYVSIGDRELRMVGQSDVKRKEFNDLIEVINQSTPQLHYEIKETKNAGDHYFTEEVGNYCKVVRT